MTQEQIERIILVEVLDFKKPERVGEHCRELARNAARKIIDGREEKLAEALVKVSVSLIAAISYIKATPETKKAAMSDMAFEQTLAGFERHLEMGRAALSITSGIRESKS